MKNEQFYKLINKLKINKIIYTMYRKRFLNSPLAFEKCDSKNIEEIRKDINDSCVCERTGSWKHYSYDLDIIVAIYNVGKMLEDCILSVVNQNSKCDYRLILVNDGSNDPDTINILNKYREYNKIIVIDKENGGVHSARNMGLSMSRGKYITFLDADDILLDGAIDILFEAAEINNADIVEGAYKNIDKDGHVIKEYPHKHGNLNYYYDMLGYPWGKIFRRELFFNIQFQNYCFEDSVMKSVILPMSNCNIGINEYVYGYRRNRESLSFSLQGNSRSIDSFWITNRLIEDRATLGIKNDQEYYEYLLNMVKLTYRRNVYLNDEYQIDLFGKWVLMFEKFKEYKTKQQKMKDLEMAIRTNNFRLYIFWNKMHMFV